MAKIATSIDELQIEIQGAAKDASTTIKNLCDNLSNLQTNIGKLDTSKFKSLSVNTSNLSANVKKMESVSKQVYESLEQITEKYKDLGKGFSFSGTFDSIQKQVDKYSNSLENAKLKKQELELSGKTEGNMYEYAIRDVIKYENILESLKKQLKEIQEVKPKIDINITGFSDMEEQAEKIVEKIRTVSIPETSFNYDPGAMAAVFGEAASKIQNYAQAVEQFGENAGMILNKTPEIKLDGAEETERHLSELKERFSNLGSSAKNAFKGFFSVLKKIGISIKNVSENIKNGLVKDFSKLTSVSKGSNNSFKKGLTTILKYSFGIRGLYTLFNKLRNAIKYGINNLVQYSSETNASVSLLNNSINQLKNAVTSMVAPLLNAFAPALNQIIQMCINAANSVNQLLSALTGKSVWIKAKKQTEDYAESVNNASNATKNALAPFDKLNNITKNEGTSGSGTSAEDMFETVNIESQFNEMAKRIKDMWSNADFTELGTIIGTKLKNALDSIDWEPIKQTASNIGKSIGTFINGGVEVEDFGNSIGKTIGEGINTGISFANSFLDNTHWDSIGNFIGEGLNGIVDTVDWSGIGHLFSQKFNAIFETIGAVAITFDWNSLGKGIADSINNIEWVEILSNLVGGISNILNGAFDFFIGFAENLDWGKLGSDLWNGLIGIITNLDWIGIISKAVRLLGDALGGAASLIVGFCESMWESLKSGFESTMSYFNTYIEEAGGNVVEGIFKGISDALNNIGNWIKENIFQPFIDGFKNAFGIHSPSKVMEEQGGYIIDGLWKGIKDSWTNITDFFSEKLSKLKETISSTWKDIKEKTSTTLSQWKTNATNNFNEFKTNTSNTLSQWKTNASNTISTFKTNVSNTLSQWKSDAENKISTFKTNANNQLNTWKTNATTVFTNFKSSATSTIQGWYSTISGYFSTSKWNFSGVKDGLEKAFNGAISGIKSIWNTFANWLNEKLTWTIDPVKVSGVTVFKGTTIKLGKIPTFATGGFPEDGWFRASKGEYFGSFDDGTSVIANNNQIISGIANGVKSANAEQNALLREQNALLRQILAKDVGISTRDIFDAVRTENRNYINRNGESAFAF